MRALEFLTEYRRDITAKNYGDKILQKVAGDRMLAGHDWMKIKRVINKAHDRLPRGGGPIISHIFGKRYEYETADQAQQILQQIRPQVLEQFLQEIEQGDPTPHKEYTQWLIKQYLNDHRNWSLEDIVSGIGEYVSEYDLLKKHRLLPLEYRDINRLGIDDVTGVVANNRDALEKLMADGKKEVNRGQAQEIYNGPDLRVIKPQDRQAACYYGQGTQWCTAATQSKNYFDAYNQRGPLYIIIPKNPKHAGEKYQFHFEDGQFMDEHDEAVDLAEVIADYPILREIFKRQAKENQIVELIIPPEVLDSQRNMVEDSVVEQAVNTLRDKTERFINSIESYLEDVSLDIPEEHKLKMYKAMEDSLQNRILFLIKTIINGTLEDFSLSKLMKLTREETDFDDDFSEYLYRNYRDDIFKWINDYTSINDALDEIEDEDASIDIRNEFVNYILGELPIDIGDAVKFSTKKILDKYSEDTPT